MRVEINFIKTSELLKITLIRLGFQESRHSWKKDLYWDEVMSLRKLVLESGQTLVHPLLVFILTMQSVLRLGSWVGALLTPVFLAVLVVVMIVISKNLHIWYVSNPQSTGQISMWPLHQHLFDVEWKETRWSLMLSLSLKCSKSKYPEPVLCREQWSY